MKNKIQFLITFLSVLSFSLFADDVSTSAELETAIINANSGGTTTINFTDNISYSQNFRPLNVNTSFENVGRSYTIDGNNNSLTASGGSFRGVFLGGNPTTSSSGIITIQNLTIDAAKAQAGTAGNGAGGGAGLGGGLFVNKGTTVRLSNVAFSNCSAEGGTGIGAGRGGGGGMGGNGGERGDGGGCGGGGSLFFDGGTGGSSSGGGGAGVGSAGQNGGNSTSGNGGNNFTGTGGGAGNSSGDGSAGSQGGGGGAGRLSAGTNGGVGSFGGGGGAAQGAGISTGGAGGFGGGGGGSQQISGGTQNGGIGGFGGGGGGVPSITLGGDGGFGGGGARGRTGGFGGGTGDGAGGGGGAMGGAIFIVGDGTLDQSDSSSTSLAGELQITGSGISSSNSSLTAGTGGNNGSTFGTDIFMMSGGQITISGLTSDISIPNAIESDQGVGIPNSSTTTGGIKLDTSIGANTGSVTLNGTNTFTGTVEVDSGTLILNGNQLATVPVNVGSSGIFSFGNINGTFNSFAVTNGNQVNLTTDTGNTSTYGGNISSTGAVTKTGDGIFVFSGNNSYSGKTTISAGTIQTGSTTALSSSSAFTVDGTLDVDNSNTIGSLAGSGNVDLATGTILTAGGDNKSTIFSGGMEGLGDFTKEGIGILILSGTNTFSGTTTVNEGILVANGSISSSNITLGANGRVRGSGELGILTINGGTASGTGTYNGIVLNSGTISPGDSIGTVNISGNYSQSSGAIYEAEIQGTNSDKIIATGTATIDTGAILTVVSLGGHFLSGTTYDILTASGGINQLWSVTNFPSNFSFNLDLVNGNTIARLTLLNTILFSGRSIDSGNPSAVKSYLDGLNIQSGTELATIVNAINSLNDIELNAALNQLHPAVFGAFELTNLDNNALITSIFSRQMIQLPCSQRACFCEKQCPSSDKKNTLWVSPFGNFADIGQYQQLRGFDTKSGGIILGYDRCLPNNFLVGTGIGYMYTNLDWHDKAGDTNIQKAFGTIYGGYSIKHFTLDVSVMGGSNFYNVKRKIQFATIDRTAKNHHNGYFATPHLGIAVNAYHKKAAISLFGNLDYFYLYQPNYTEKGASSLNLQVDTKNSHMLRSEIGGNLYRDFVFNGGCIRPFVALSWVNKARLSSDRYKAQFANSTSVSNTIVVETFKKNKNFISPETGVIFTKNKYTFSMIYKGEFARRYQINQINAKIQWAF